MKLTQTIVNALALPDGKAEAIHFDEESAPAQAGRRILRLQAQTFLRRCRGRNKLRT